MVLSSFGIPLEERVLRRRMKTNFIFGTRHHHFVPIVEAYGLYARVKKKASFTDLDQALVHGNMVIVNFIEQTASASHYAPVVALDETSIVMHDPYSGANTSMTREEFWTRWQSRNRLWKGNWYKGWMLEVASAPFEN